ncbi:MAG: MFS transporter [Firmicutes bacterium]|nr:MFS transporter [Bacillota bacterium]
MRKELKLYFAILALTAFALGITSNVISNFFKDAYDVTAYQRGFLEFPRELPGIISIFVIAGLSFLSDIRISIIAQVLSFIGIAILGFTTPTYNVMILLVFINSMGMHLFFPLQDSIGLDLAEKDNIGKRLGQFKGFFTGVQMLAAMFVFWGFREGFMSFETPFKLTFVIAAAMFLAIIIMLVVLERWVRIDKPHVKQNGYVFRKAYKYYYVLIILFGVQKQIMMVYGPWVLIDLLSKKADTISILTVIGSFIGIFFIPAVGKWLDRFGVRKLLFADAISFIGVYLVYGLLCVGYINGSIQTAGLGVVLAYAIFIIDRMSSQMGIVRTVYLRKIAIMPSDITPTLTLGQSMDHAVSIVCAYLGGVIWSLWGPQYIFFIAAGFSLINLYVAFKVHVK